ncbi:MAG TPA: choice-of-anchor D domain-containing protein [Candidatus Acidoferrum sp.]|nr:choice-of-anchor D domain-containing protein [Candidatus Acidoferrum sp.]
MKIGRSSHKALLFECAGVLHGPEIPEKNWKRVGPSSQQMRTPDLLREFGKFLEKRTLLAALALAPLTIISGCAGLVSGNNTTPPTTLTISNVQATSMTTSATQIVWSTNVPADSAVIYGTTTSYGNSTPVDSTMVTNHQVMLSGLAAGTTYYYQVASTDAKNNHGKGSGSFKTAGYSISGAISPVSGGAGAVVSLTGAASATTTADGSGNFALTGLPNGTYGITPSHSGFKFTPSSQSMTVNGANVTGVQFTVSATSTAPTITTQPVNQTVTAGQTATFTVVAGGTAPLSYQWQKNGVNISGATASSYTTPVTATTDSGSTFQAVVTNTAGTVTSSAATLTVNAAPVAPTITTQPVNQTVTAGQTATFTVVAGGTAPLSYQWQKNGVNISGATASSYTTPVTATTDSGSTFAVVVTNTAGTVTSSAATLTVNPAPAPAIQVTPNPVNFGSADVVGTTTTQPLIIKNTGTATLTITQISASGAPFSVSGFSLPLNVNAGQQTTINSAFAPTATGLASGSISIVSNAAGSPTSVSLSGTAIAATLTLGITPGSLNFGNVTTGTTSLAQTVTISNTGNSNVTISQITLSGAGYLMTGGAAPVTLTPSQTLTLSVTFGPSVAGSVNGSVSIVSNATGSPTAVTLTGTGVTPVQHSVALTWNASTSSNVTGYNVYRTTTSGTGYVKINSSLIGVLSYTDSTVQNGTTYFYVTTAVDSSGNESVFSNEVSAPIP